MITLKVNGKTHSVDAEPDTPLLWVLREHLGLTGTKYGCGIGECGACTVHLNGEAAKSCDISVENAAGAEITTIEGLAAGNKLHPVQAAFVADNTSQCGFCIPGHIMKAAALLASNPEPSDEEIDLAVQENICRCGAYTRIRQSIHRAAKSTT
jgi:aerobic-type carbon monoxide dehydrogenase small subunit (CoxS/CutS family)